MPPAPAVPGTSYPLREGDIAVLNSMSSVVVTLRTVVTVRYDDGQWDELLVPPLTTDGARTQQFVSGQNRAKRNGVVTSVLVLPSIALKRGQVYISVGLSKGPGAATSLFLAGGYLHDNGQFVLGTFVDSGPGAGEGNVRTVTGSNPAAGAEVSETVPANVVWRLLSFSVVLVTAVAVANRNAHLVADDGTTANRRWFVLNTANQTASTTRTWLYFPGNDVTNIASNSFADTDTVLMQGNLPPDDGPRTLPEGYRIRTITGGIQAADDYAAPIFQVEEWLVF